MIKHYKFDNWLCEVNFDINLCTCINSDALFKSRVTVPVHMRSHISHIKKGFGEISADVFNKFDKLVSYKDEM